MKSTHPVVTLLTDFGSTDAYAGVMKGVILSRCPGARIIDITHEIGPQDVQAAAYVLESSYRYFPKGTVHVTVVDPGVGSSRAGLAASASGHYFVAPDNGVLTAVFQEAGPEKVVRLENKRCFLHPVSRTFHGRDIFAPVAGTIASGTSLDELGPPMESWVQLSLPEPRNIAPGLVEGEVIYVDHFGNLVTNIKECDIGPNARIEIKGTSLPGLSHCYADVAPGALLAIIGSTGRVEISVNLGNAADQLRCAPGEKVRVIQ